MICNPVELQSKIARMISLCYSLSSDNGSPVGGGHVPSFPMKFSIGMCASMTLEYIKSPVQCFRKPWDRLPDFFMFLRHASAFPCTTELCWSVTSELGKL